MALVYNKRSNPTSAAVGTVDIYAHAFGFKGCYACVGLIEWPLQLGVSEYEYAFEV